MPRAKSHMPDHGLQGQTLSRVASAADATIRFATIPRIESDFATPDSGIHHFAARSVSNFTLNSCSRNRSVLGWFERDATISCGVYKPALLRNRAFDRGRCLSHFTATRYSHLLLLSAWWNKSGPSSI